MISDPILGACAVAAPQSASWLDWGKTLAAICALPLAGTTFWLGYRQKERERTRSYYHKAVVDIVLPKILESCAQETERLLETGRTALAGLKSARKTMPRSCNIALAEFTKNWFALQDLITERTLIFDERITEEIRQDFQSTEDDAKEWFNEVSLHKRRNVEDLDAIMKKSQRTVIKRLYRGDFRDF